ncbi:MAG: cytochrome C oxidase subunit IV family protein [Anaerolineae bacterium]
MQESKAALLRRGELVFGGLIALTILEFLVSVYLNSLTLLALTAAPKAVLIVEYYMHLRRVGQAEEEGGH